MAPITVTAYHLTRRAADPLIHVWGQRYAHESIPIKIIIWIFSLFLGAIILASYLGIAGMLLYAVGALLYAIFRGIYEVVIFIVRSIISGVQKLQAKNEERRGRKREREDTRYRQRGERVGRSARRNGGHVANIDAQAGHKEGDMEMGIMGEMRNQGPLPMRVGLPPAYCV